MACGGGGGGGGGGSSSTNSTTPQINNQNEVPTETSAPILNYKTSIEQNLSIFNEKNSGLKTLLTPTFKTTNSIIDSSYKVRSYNGSGISFLYTFDTDKKFVMIDYDRLSRKVTLARIDTTDSTLSCQNTPSSPSDCDGISVIYDDHTGSSNVLFNQKRFENIYYKTSETSPNGSEEIKYQVVVNGSIKGNISTKPLLFSDFQKTHTGNISVNGKEMDIFRTYMRDSQLVVQFTNGESMYLLTSNSSGLTNTYYTANESLSSSDWGTLKKTGNGQVNIKFDNIRFNSKANTKVVSGDITLIDSNATINITNVGKIETNEAYAYELSNTEMTYFITSTSGHGYIVTQGQKPVSIDINGYSCTLNNCKNVAISKDGTYIKLNGTLLSGVSVTGTIRTNIH